MTIYSKAIEVGINNLNILSQVENLKTRKYDLIALTYKFKVRLYHM
jgi:hypothetical protein